MSRVVTPSTPHTTTTTMVPHDKIALRAYEKWCKRGRPQGTEKMDWLEAEQELKMEFSKNPPMPTRR